LWRFEYYPFGMQMPGRKYSQPNSSYRYGFNGKELDNSTGEGNLDFGARIMDVRLGRWLGVDPFSFKSPDFSPYNFCFNSPNIYKDPNGEYPVVEISDQVSGFTFAHVYGNDGKVSTIIVNTYKMIVYDVNAKGERKQLAEFQVTRDGYYNQGPLPPTSSTVEKTEGFLWWKKTTTTTTTTTSELLVNRTSEPTQDVTVTAKPTKDYGDTKGAYALSNFNVEPAPASWGKYTSGDPVEGDAQRKTPNTSSGVMIHIGGFFTNSEGAQLGGTYGCYGVVDPSQIFSNYVDAFKVLGTYDNIEKNHVAPNGIKSSNNQMNMLVDFVNAAVAAAKKRKEADTVLRVTIKKRSAEKGKGKEVKVVTSTSSTSTKK
jgi:RHS repeat-associated protein